jgi:hypothetical protein
LTSGIKLFLEKWSLHSFLTTVPQQADVAGNIFLLFFFFLFWLKIGWREKWNCYGAVVKNECRDHFSKRYDTLLLKTQFFDHFYPRDNFYFYIYIYLKKKKILKLIRKHLIKQDDQKLYVKGCKSHISKRYKHVYCVLDQSTTFTVMEPETQSQTFTGKLGPNPEFFIYSQHFNPTVRLCSCAQSQLSRL